MKKLILIFVTLTSTFSTTTPENIVVKTNNESVERGYRYMKEWKANELIKMNKKLFEGFLDELSFRESTNNPNAINTLGYIGEFQFGRAALKDVGMAHITTEKFRNNPSIFPKECQRVAVTKLMKINYKRMERLADKYCGVTIAGVEITKSGLIGAAHIAGAGGVNKFLRTNGRYNPRDINGTYLSDYLKEFSGHEFKIELV